MLAGKAESVAQTARSPRHPFHRLLVKFLFILCTIFIVTALPGIWFLIDYQLREGQDVLAARLGNHTARTALALERQMAHIGSTASQDLIAMLAVDRAFLCAEVVGTRDGKVLLAQPPQQGCIGRLDGQELTLVVSDDPPTRLRVRYTDAEYRKAEALLRSVSISVVAVAFMLAVVAATLGFRFIVNRPLEKLLRSIRMSAETGDRQPVVSHGRDEIHTVIREFNEMILRDTERESHLKETNTELRATEAHLKELNEDLDSRVRKRTAELEREKLRAEDANLAKSRFLASMSHELRTPLNAIIGFSSVMKQEVFGRLGHPRYVEYTADIKSSGEHLLNVINDILDIAKIESGSAKLEEEVVDVADLANNCIRLVQPLANRKNLSLRSDQIELGVRLSADPTKLTQILVNLLSNAIKFTPAGGSVELTVRIEPDRALEISVIDTGIGMQEEDIPLALSNFGQIDNKLARNYEGTGLGLPLAKCMAELHGGTLEIASVPGHGTRVTVRLPDSRIVSDGTEAA